MQRRKVGTAMFVFSVQHAHHAKERNWFHFRAKVSCTIQFDPQVIKLINCQLQPFFAVNLNPSEFAMKLVGVGCVRHEQRSSCSNLPRPDFGKVGMGQLP